MDKTVHLTIVTPDATVFDAPVDYVGAFGVEGNFGVLAEHESMLIALVIGWITYKVNGKYKYIFSSGGFAEITAKGVTILSDSAVAAEDINIERAGKAKERAEQRLTKMAEDIDETRAKIALIRAITRLKTFDLSGKI